MNLTNVTRAGLAAAVLTVCCALTIGSAGDKKVHIKPFLPPDIYKELVTRELKLVQAALGKEDLKDLQKGKVAALMIAMYTLTAQDGDASALAGVRAAALRLAEIVADKDKADEAKKLIDAIASFKGNASLKSGEIVFQKYVPNDYDLMVTYMGKTKGGDGLHPDLQFSSRLQDGEEYIENLFAYMSKKPLPDKHMKKGVKELELIAYRTAASAELINAYVPKQKKKDRDPELWLKTSAEMRESALNLAAAAKKQDGEAVQKASTALLASCVSCHKMFQK